MPNMGVCKCVQCAVANFVTVTKSYPRYIDLIPVSKLNNSLASGERDMRTVSFRVRYIPLVSRSPISILVVLFVSSIISSSPRVVVALVRLVVSKLVEL